MVELNCARLPLVAYSSVRRSWRDRYGDAWKMRRDRHGHVHVLRTLRHTKLYAHLLSFRTSRRRRPCAAGSGRPEPRWPACGCGTRGRRSTPGPSLCGPPTDHCRWFCTPQLTSVNTAAHGLRHPVQHRPFSYTLPALQSMTHCCVCAMFVKPPQHDMLISQPRTGQPVHGGGFACNATCSRGQEACHARAECNAMSETRCATA